MTQSFTFREPVSDLDQGVLTGANMMPPWKQSAAYNLLPNDGVALEKSGQKRRRDSELTRGLMPNERLSNDPVQRSGSGPPLGGNNFCDLGAAQSAFPIERRGFYSRMIQTASSGIFPLTGAGVSYEPVDHQHNFNHGAANPSWNSDLGTHVGNARYRSHRPAARSLDSAAAAAAQAMANFQAIIDEGRSRFQAYNGNSNGTQGYGSTILNAQEGQQLESSNHQFTAPSYGSTILNAQGGQQLESSNHQFTAPSYGSTQNHFNSGIGTQNGYLENLSSFGGANTNGHMRSEVNVSSETSNWPNLNCQTTVSNASRSLFESNPLGFSEPQSPCTPRGPQRINTVLSDSQQEYLQHMERINSNETPDTPQHNSRGRRLSYIAPQEQSATDHSIFRDFERAPASNFQADKHLHIYLDSEVPKHVDDWTSGTHVDEFPVPETTGFNVDVDLEDAQQERFSQSHEPAPAMAPAESNIGFGEKDTSGNDRFDLNEVPAGVGEAATPKPRKKYHPRVAKDKRTYKRRVDGKKVPASPVDGVTNMNSPAKKAGRRSSNQTQYDSTNEEGRDSGHPEVVDMDIECNGYVHTTSQHDTAVCDCEACIKNRLEKRMPQSPVSPPEHHSRGNTWGRSTLQQSTPPRDSSSNSPPVRRNLFQSSAQAPELDQGIGAAARRSLGSFDTTNDPQQLIALVIPHKDAAYTAVKSFFNAQAVTRTATSCLQQFNESAAQLGLTRRNLLHQQNNFSSAIVPANPASFEWNPPFSHNQHVPATNTNNSFMSRLCPRGILSPQRVPFRNMNAIQRVVYLKSILTSSHQLQMLPESLLRHVYDHLPENEKVEFKESLWPIILTPLTDEQMKQLKEYAESDQVGPSAVVEVVKRRGPKVKKPSKKELAMTLWPDLMQDSQAMKSNSKAGKGEKGRKNINSASGSGIISQNGLEMVPYENKSMVPYDGPFNPLRKKKNRPKVVLDNETVRVWKLLMGKTGSEGNETDAEKELKWGEERRKMKAQARNFIERMHIVQGDRSFSKWKGSVVDSVVGAFLTQNVNDVLSSSAFMSMRSRFPGRGYRKPSETKVAPEEAVAQSFESELPQHPSPPAPSPPIQEQPQRSGIQETSSSYTQSSTQDVAAQSNSECTAPSVTVLESHESRNEESYDILHMEAASTREKQPGVLDPSCQKEDSKTSNSVLTEEMSSGANNGVNQADVISPENGIALDMTTESELAEGINQPSHGKYNPKTGLTGLERAKKEEKQVTARKSFDFSGLQEEFKPRVQGQERPAAPPRTEATEDGVDWEAVRRANVAEVADVIKERGLNWILAGRIKAFLERIHLDYGALDLEWLRSMSTDQTKDFLLSVRGLGLKSVECIRLLTLHHLAFPVDTNVGRICVRLGWVPLEPLPEELQLHLLELYPVQATIQKYLWPRLCKLDHQTLYELHYQMISFGKVFCTKSRPNCNACPMRPECKHFASALSSAKLALPAAERPHNGPTLALPPSTSNDPGENIPEPTSHPEPARPVSQYCQPIVEEPMTPESEADIEELDIEDYPFSVQELIEEETDMNICIQDQHSTEAGTTQTVQQQSESTNKTNCCSTSINVTIPDTEPIPESVSEVLSVPVQESIIMEDWGGLAAATSASKGVNSDQESCPNNVIKIVESTNDPDEESNEIGNPCVTESVLVPNIASSQEMVVVAPGAASLPVPKLKNVGRLRTVHYVYELPDNHPLLDELDPREGDDPCTYLLAIWSPGEVPESIPNINDSVNDENGPFASSSSEGDESIKATLLVPCRTAMRGSFPLNGTYFQVNEVFADHASSLQPMLVPRTLLWNLRRRFVFFGTSVQSIFRGMTAPEIQACFWRGYVCVRGFDRSTRAPKPLVGRLHLQAGKASGKGANADA